jgi:hypothetical protein
MREAITQYVDREEKRENFRQDTLKTSNTAYPSPSDKALPPVDRCANA